MVKKTQTKKLPNEHLDGEDYLPLAANNPLEAPHYEVFVSCQYVIRAPLGKIARVFKTTFRVATLDNLRHKVKRYLLPRAIPKQDPSFVRLRTFEIDNVIPRNGAKANREVGYMNRSQLENLIASEGFEVDSRYFTTLAELRSAVEAYIEDPDAFKNNYKVKTEAQKKKFDITTELESLNPELYAFDEAEYGSTPKPPSKPTEQEYGLDPLTDL